MADPGDPYRSGYAFDGWFLDKPGYTQQWDFENDVVTKDIILHAKWTQTAPTATPTPAQSATPAPTISPTPNPDATPTPIPDETPPVTDAPCDEPVSVPEYSMPEASTPDRLWEDILIWDYHAVDGVLYTSDGTLVRYPAAMVNASFTPAEGTTAIGAYAFAYTDSVYSVTVPEGVSTVQRYGFYHCDALSTLLFPQSLLTMEDSAVYACPALTSITFAVQPETMGSNLLIGSSPDLMIHAPDDAAKLFAMADQLHYACNEYTITFLSDGAVLGTGSARAGFVLPTPPNQASDRYRTFLGWIAADGGEPWNFKTGVMPAHAMQLYALW